VFDAPGLQGKVFEDRMEIIKQHFRDHPAPYVKVVKQQLCGGMN
jgi:hypothetical protein